MPLGVDKQVFWLQVPVEDAVAVEVLEAEEGFAKVGASICLLHASAFEVAVELTSGVEIQEEVEMVEGLERAVEPDGVTVVLELGEYLLFSEDLLEFLIVADVAL